MCAVTGLDGIGDEDQRTIVRTLVLIGLLSTVDLVWTLLASGQPGAMLELNPLGRGLTRDPVRLVAFKSTVTAISIALLYWLQQRPLAQRVAWWTCLVLTLMTARWLTFQSLFL
jgi:hypothetical protein